MKLMALLINIMKIEWKRFIYITIKVCPEKWSFQAIDRHRNGKGWKIFWTIQKLYRWNDQAFPKYGYSAAIENDKKRPQHYVYGSGWAPDVAGKIWIGYFSAVISRWFS